MIDTNFEHWGVTLKEAAPTKPPDKMTTQKQIQMGFGNRNATGNAEAIIVRIKSGSVIHSLREDLDNEFKAGRKFQLYSTPSKSVKKHAGQMECTGFQRALLKSDNVNVFVFIDGLLLMGSEMVRFYRNEGFDSLDDFLAYYKPVCAKSPNMTIKRKLIHWTAFRY